MNDSATAGAIDSTAAPHTAWNEAYAADGSVRPHWQYLLGALGELGEDVCAQRQQMLERILRDDGATYNDYSSSDNTNLAGRPWTLDAIPQLIDSQQWSEIETGLRERAELLDLVLRDFYGERSLLRLGVIPPELVLSHHGFLRACHGIGLPGEPQLIQYAVDMVRGPDGAMQVIADRTQAPSGAGYALENRVVMSRVFPSLFRDSHVHRLSLYYNRLRLTLQALNPNDNHARVAVLTPGPYSETYFEQLFLANHLGYPLVQGSDLTVRDGFVWMKTLNGLSRIDVIMRRVDDDYCDPVELRGDSQLGVPGLLEVIRCGRVAVANPLGSGVLENPGLLKYLPAAARHFLGRELALPAAPTYWCGDPADLAFTLEHLGELVIKPTARSAASQNTWGRALSSAQLAELRAAIQARPLYYAAQAYVEPSVSPLWHGGDIEVQPAVLRGFAVAGESSWTVMPGGLTRIGRQPGSPEISNRSGSLSKDTWVLASEPEKQELPAGAALVAGGAPGRPGLELPSRVVENLFWVGRYMERAESALRLLRIVFNKLSGATALDGDSRLLLLRAVTQLTCTYPGFIGDTTTPPDTRKELLDIVLNRARPGTVAASIVSLLRAVDPVKDFVSADTQRILNNLQDDFEQLPGRLRGPFSVVPEEQLDSLITTLLALAGLAEESMMRSQGWRFLEMGRRIERAQQVLSLLRSLLVPAVPPPGGYLMLEAALLSLESLITYRRRHQRDMEIEHGLDLLLLEPDNPRSVMFQLNELHRHLEHMPASGDGARLAQHQRLLLEATTKLQLADMQRLAQPKKGEFLRTELDQLLARVHYLAGATATALSDQYFDHSASPQPLGGGAWETLP